MSVYSGKVAGHKFKGSGTIANGYAWIYNSTTQQFELTDLSATYAPVGADYLVGTTQAGLTGEIVVGTAPGGELGGTWASPTVDTTHSGSSHAGVVTTHEAAADPHTGYLKETDFDDIDFLVGTATGHTAAEIVVGTSPGGELGGTWASPTVDTTHSGSAHLGDHGARVTKADVQAITTATLTAITFDTERWDTDAYHDNVTNNTRLTVPAGQGGTYIISFSAQFAGNGTGSRYFYLNLNGTTKLAGLYLINNGTAAFEGTLTTIFQLDAGDYVEAVVYQDSGGSLNINKNNNSSPEFSLQRIA